MRIVVVGAGKVGFELAARLAHEGHEVIVVDKDAEALEAVESHLDVMTYVGNGASPMLLQRIGIAEADLLIAVTEIDEVNMIACMTAKAYGARTCVARIRNPDYATAGPRAFSLAALGIDLVIDPEQVAAIEIVRLLETPSATEVELFANGRVVMAGYMVEPGAPIAGRTLADVRLTDLLVAALVRGDEVIIPQGTDHIEAGDQMIVIGRTGSFGPLRAMIGAEERTIRSVVIVGASRIGTKLAAALRPNRKAGIHVMLVEKDPWRAREAAETLPDVLVVQGDGTKIDVLREEGVDSYDALVAVTGEDDTNLLATMLGKELGVGEVITVIGREDYVPLARKAGADAVVVPRLLTVAGILKLVRPATGLVSLTLLQEGRAEILEFRAQAGCRAAGRSLRELSFPRGAIVAAVLHKGRTAIAHGDTVIRPGDRVIVFALPEATSEVEALFGTPVRRRVGAP
ncbi:MAG: Trk system potassium transporter TrkA [Firmicutes bacterium]|nr:Trk system potassium transporter TrkA [Bacillota bacterium]